MILKRYLLVYCIEILESYFGLFDCNYISDLRFLVKEVYQKIHKINFKEYDICELQKFFSYVFNIEISNYEDIEKFLNN